MASSRCCGRQIEVSDSGQEMPCACILPPLDVWRPGEVYCDRCGDEVRLPGFCATCAERET